MFSSTFFEQISVIDLKFDLFLVFLLMEHRKIKYKRLRPTRHEQQRNEILSLVSFHSKLKKKNITYKELKVL